MYTTVDLSRCRNFGHKFRLIHSDKSPLRFSLICITCTEQSNGDTVMVAHGDDTKSWGQWRQPARESE